MKKLSSIQKDFTKIFKSGKLGFQHIDAVHKNAELIVSSLNEKGDIINKKVFNIIKYKGFSLNIWLLNSIYNNIEVFDEDVVKVVVDLKIDVFYEYGKGNTKINKISGHNIKDCYKKEIQVDSLTVNGKIVGFQSTGALVEMKV